MSPVYFLKHTIFPEVGYRAQFPIHFPTHVRVLKFSRTGARKVKESVQEIAPCPKLQEIWIFFQ